MSFTNAGRSDRTIRRRMSNSLRHQKGLPPVLKRQLCQTKPEYAKQALYHKLCDDTEIGEAKRFFRLSQSKNQIKVFKAECNLYGFDHQLLSCKAQKHFFNRQRSLVSSVLGKDGGQQ
ncbi:MAG: hypothetical protein NW220_17840 [Leptolyngbyaceae cyanobacterium bins.349]|nr:hypothetical protein [Leptolyngbyaceae cyanobacterium bins.349]